MSLETQTEVRENSLKEFKNNKAMMPLLGQTPNVASTEHITYLKKLKTFNIPITKKGNFRWGQFQKCLNISQCSLS